MSDEASTEPPDSAVTGKLAKLNANTGREVTESEKVAAEVLLDANPPLTDVREKLVMEIQSRLSEKAPCEIDFRHLLARKVSLTKGVDLNDANPERPIDDAQ